MRINKIIIILAGAIGAEAAAVMVGWFFGIDSLTRILSYGINMAFPTALMFFLSAIGLYFIDKAVEGGHALSHIILSGVTLLIFLITITILIGGLIGAHTGMDNLFIQDQPSLVINDTVAGLPAPSTIFSFILFGLVNIIASFPSQKRQNRIKFFGYFIITIGLVAMVGYVLKLPLLYYKLSELTIPMAFNTALSFSLLGWGLIVIGRKKEFNEA